MRLKYLHTVLIGSHIMFINAKTGLEQSIKLMLKCCNDNTDPIKKNVSCSKLITIVQVLGPQDHQAQARFVRLPSNS